MAHASLQALVWLKAFAKLGQLGWVSHACLFEWGAAALLSTALPNSSAGWASHVVGRVCAGVSMHASVLFFRGWPSFTTIVMTKVCDEALNLPGVLTWPEFQQAAQPSRCLCQHSAQDFLSRVAH